MTDDSRLSDIPPLGRSVEEVESESSNRVNPDAPGEARRTVVDEAFPTNQTNLSTIPAAGAVGPALREREGAGPENRDNDLPDERD
ncbi:hypothetical protein [Deinococcus pimensis]|uniref:hypothetical protein n=1 Tax=Deinococcus pimensis TaxID=309888 RepID=UPI0004AD58C5|nr:hypothetical protein [Deinococcus pimensis]